MCGVVVQFSKNSTVIPNKFNESLKLLHHRGPDDIDHTLLRNNSLCFGHTRLSIVGIGNGRQPLSTPDKNLFAIVNGEFYDYKQIKQELALDGYQFTTESDSEIILPLYKKYKSDCFNKLNGEFAGIIYDVIEDKLIIFRDRHGVKPLFFKNTSTDLIIASEIKSILAIDASQPEWNLTYLKQYLSLAHRQDQTIFKDIYHVKPSHYMVIDLKTSAISEHRYWTINFDKQSYLTDPLPNLANQYKEHFCKAVSRRLVADVPVATYLSGGIDSSACYGVASTLAGYGVDAFTIAFEHPDYNEFNQAQTLVKKYNGKQHVVSITEQLLIDNFEKHLWNMEAPVLNPHSVAKYLLSKLVRESGFKVVITGEGSDEYNAGYVLSVIDALKCEYHNTTGLPQELLNVSAGAMLTQGAHELEMLKPIFGFSSCLFENAAATNSFLNELFLPKYQVTSPEQVLGSWAKDFYRPEMKNWDALNTSLYMTGQVFFSYVLSVLGDRTEMAHSVEARLPFLDHNLLEFLAKIPPKYKIQPNMDKFLLREALKEFVTPEHYKTHKHPYLAPPLVTKNSLFANYMHDTFSSNWFKNMGLFDSNKTLSLLKKSIDQSNPNPDLEKSLFKILSTATIHKIYRFKNL